MKAWVVFSFAVLLVACGINVVAMARRILPPPRAASAVPANVVMRHEVRMSVLRQAMNREGVSGIVGYIADVPAPELARDARGMQEYFLTQFALVPRVLDAKAQDCQWAIVNLHTTPIAQRMPAGFQVNDDCGDGVFLLRRVERLPP